jgi:hypothetical protein
MASNNSGTPHARPNKKGSQGQEYPHRDSRDDSTNRQADYGVQDDSGIVQREDDSPDYVGRQGEEYIETNLHPGDRRTDIERPNSGDEFGEVDDLDEEIERESIDGAENGDEGPL